MFGSNRRLPASFRPPTKSPSRTPRSMSLARIGKAKMLVCWYESIFGNRPCVASRLEEGARRLAQGAREMGGYLPAGTQRVDLLDYLGEAREYAKGPCEKDGLRAHRRDAPAVLLDRVHPPHG
jgi:hypothetical protein